jgi:hypothetical protein
MAGQALEPENEKFKKNLAEQMVGPGSKRQVANGCPEAFYKGLGR